MSYTKMQHERELNEYEIPEDDRQSNGGRIPDWCKYGSWLRRKDPVAFAVSYAEARR